MIDCGTFQLRPLQATDKKSLAFYANNYHIWRNVRDAFPHPYRMNDAEEFIRYCRDKKTITNFCIDHKSECIGVIGYIPQPDVYKRSAEIGYWLGEPFWGKGIMTTAVKQLSAYIFEHTEIVRLYAGIFEWNKPSTRVLEKAGFKQDCIFERSVYKDGQLINEYRYSLLKPGWQ